MKRLYYISALLFAALFVLMQESSTDAFLRGEQGAIEVIQALLLGASIFVVLSNFSRLRRRYSYFQAFIRFAFLAFVLFEELSVFIPSWILPSIRNSSYQAEVNFHNQIFLKQPFFSSLADTPLSGLGLFFSWLTTGELLLGLFFLVIIFAGYIPTLKQYRLLYLAPEIARWMLPWLLFFAFRLFLRALGWQPPIVEAEMMELQLYGLIFFDCLLVCSPSYTLE